MASDSALKYDLIVIGAGPAGEKGAAQAAYFGKRVALIEGRDVGGTAVNTGTLPSKTLRETALYLSGFRQRGLYGVDYRFDEEVTVDDLIRRERGIVHGHQMLVEENIRRHSIEFYHGTATIEDAHTVLVSRLDGAPVRLTGEVLLIATGSRPFRPPDVPFDGRAVYDSDSLLHLKHIPRSLIVIGAGVVGSEYATLFAALGIEVILIDGREQLLPSLDREVSNILAERMGTLGVWLRLGQVVRRIEIAGQRGVCITLERGEELSCEALLFSGGRSGNTDKLGLEQLGVRTSTRGLVQVNERFQTAVPNIYAAGDVIGPPALASTSMEQARVAVCDAFRFEYKQHVSNLVPQAIYTIPEVSMVGATEQSLQVKKRPYLVGRASYRINPRAQILGDTTGLVKLLFDPGDRRVLGVHVIGEQASELIHIGQACMHFEGTLDFFIESVFNFPTLSDLYKYAAYDGLGKLRRR
ncbi:MAG: Si-specific NAD(P)(+) transhydrogenase [Dehalococcoidia bacterium]